MLHVFSPRLVASLLFSRFLGTLKVFCRAARYREATPNQLKEILMPKFVIERSILGIGGLSAGDLQSISQESCSVLRELGSDVQWVQSYVTGDKIYCIYNAASEQQLRNHARLGGFPIDSMARVVSTIDPTTAEA
jgi:hypothetical protein